jgi:hypothetical protein
MKQNQERKMPLDRVISLWISEEVYKFLCNAAQSKGHSSVSRETRELLNEKVKEAKK